MGYFIRSLVEYDQNLRVRLDSQQHNEVHTCARHGIQGESQPFRDYHLHALYHGAIKGADRPIRWSFTVHLLAFTDDCLPASCRPRQRRKPQSSIRIRYATQTTQLDTKERRQGLF